MPDLRLPSDPAHRTRGERRWFALLAIVLLVAAVGLVATSLSPSGSGASSRSSTTVPTTVRTLAPVRLVVLGDSVPAGGGCPCPTFAALLGRQLQDATGRPVLIDNAAASGATSESVLATVNDATARQSLSTADIVVVQVGANDLDSSTFGSPACEPVATSDCWTDDLHRLGINLQATMRAVRSAAPGRSVHLVLIGYWNVSVDGQVAAERGTSFRNDSDAVTAMVNQVISQSATADHADYVDLVTPFTGSDGSRDPSGLLLEDGDHPNAAGHRLIADAVTSRLLTSGVITQLTEGPRAGTEQTGRASSASTAAYADK